jgi:hypothetical protein
LIDPPQDRIAAAWNEAVDRHVAGLSDTELADLLARTRPQTTPAAHASITTGDTASVRRSLAAKSADLLSIPKDRNGPTGPGSFAAAVAARAPKPTQ